MQQHYPKTASFALNFHLDVLVDPTCTCTIAVIMQLSNLTTFALAFFSDTGNWMVNSAQTRLQSLQQR